MNLPFTRNQHPVLRRVSTSYRDDLKFFTRRSERVWAVIIAALAIVLPFLLTKSYTPPLNYPWRTWLAVLDLTLIAAIGATAFNLLVGYTGQLSLAHAGFLAIGAMMAGTVGPLWGWPMALALIVATITGGLVGVLAGLPALRLRGPYLLLATLGIYWIADLVWREWLKRYYGTTGVQFKRPALPSWMEGLPGIKADEKTGQFQFNSNFRWYWFLLIMAVLSITFLRNIVRSSEGRAFVAVKERDVSASLLGINVARTKLTAFAVSSALVALAGALNGYYLSAASESSFPITLTINFAIMIVVGGFSSLQGAVFGAFFFQSLPVITKWARAEVGVIKDIKFVTKHGPIIDNMIFGALIVIVLVFKPEGLSGVWRSIRNWFARWPFTT